MTWLQAGQPHTTVISSRSLAYSATFLVSGALGFAVTFAWQNNVRLLIGQGEAGYRNIFRRTRVWTRGEVSRAIEMAIAYGTTSTPRRAIYLFDGEGMRVLVLTVAAWTTQDIGDFVRALGIPLEVRDSPVRIKDVRNEFPRAFGWGAQHVMLATLITMAIAVGLAAAIFAIFSR